MMRRFVQEEIYRHVKLQLFQSLPDEVVVGQRNQRVETQRKQSFDFAAINFANQFVSVHARTGHFFFINAPDVGDKGAIMANLHNPKQIEFRPRWGETKIIDVELPEEGGHGGADPLLVENFIASLKGEGHPSASVRDGIKAVAIGQAAEISWREQRKVDISELVNLNDSRLLI